MRDTDRMLLNEIRDLPLGRDVREDLYGKVQTLAAEVAKLRAKLAQLVFLDELKEALNAPEAVTYHDLVAVAKDRMAEIRDLGEACAGARRKFIDEVYLVILQEFVRGDTPISDTEDAANHDRIFIAAAQAADARERSLKAEAARARSTAR